MKKELLSLMTKINKDFGMNALRPAVDLEEVVWRFSTGSLSLDIGMGGGIPVGRMTQIAGGFSACKSAILYHAIANAQKTGKKKVRWERYCTKDKEVQRWIPCNLSSKGAEPFMCALSQSESHSYSNEWAGGIGVDVKELIFNQPFGMEEAIDIAIALQESGELDVQGHDSYGAYKPIKVLETDQKDSVRMGIKQQALDDYHGKYQAHNNKLEREGKIPTTLIALNQLREKIGGYGDPEYETGGRSVGFTSSIIIRLRKGDYIKIGTGDNARVIGQVVKFKIPKNKTYKPFQTGEFDFYFDEGGPVPPGHIDNAKELIVEAICYGIIEKKGSWLAYNGINIAQGADKTIQIIREDKKMFEEIKNKVMKVAFESDVEREDVFGTDEILPGELTEDAPISLESINLTTDDIVIPSKSKNKAIKKKKVIKK